MACGSGGHTVQYSTTKLATVWEGTKKKNALEMVVNLAEANNFINSTGLKKILDTIPIKNRCESNAISRFIHNCLFLTRNNVWKEEIKKGSSQSHLCHVLWRLLTLRYSLLQSNFKTNTNPIRFAMFCWVFFSSSSSFQSSLVLTQSTLIYCNKEISQWQKWNKTKWYAPRVLIGDSER